MDVYGLTRGVLADIEGTFRRDVKPILCICNIKRSKRDEFALRVSDGASSMWQAYLNEDLKQLMLNNALLLTQGSVIRVKAFYPIITTDPLTTICKPGMLINDVEILHQVQRYGHKADAA